MADTADNSKRNNLVKADPGRSVGVIGIPMNKGQEKKGTEKAPDTLRQGGLIKKLEEVGRQVKDYGNMHFQPENEDPDYLNVRNPKYVAQATLQIAETVEKILLKEGHCIALGGDHSIAIGTISGHVRVNPDIVVLWIDAHGDINTPLTSDSGNIHGMPLSLIKQLDPYIPPLPGWEDINPCIDGKQIAWIGLRSVDWGESKIFDKFGFHTFYMDDIEELGIRSVELSPESCRPGLTVPGVQIGVLGVPMCKGQGKHGAEKGADALRQGGLIQRLKDLGCQVTDYGDLTFDNVDDDPNCGKVRNPRYLAKATLKIANKVQEVLQNEGTCMTLGGDHSIAIGTIMGHARVQPDIVVLWIDAHVDINTPLTSDSGNIHGMPLSFLIRELDPYVPKLPDWENIKPCIDGKQIAWIGLRSVDHGERKIIDQFGLHAFSKQDVDKHGIRDVLDMALKALDPEGVRPIHVSFDIDSMDPAYTPCTGTPVNGGLTVREISYIAEEIAKTGRLAMIDIAELNPEIGSEKELEMTVRSIIDVVPHFFGHRRRGYYKPDYEIPKVHENIAA